MYTDLYKVFRRYL